MLILHSQQIDNLKKENFDLKLKLHFLEERLAQLAPDQVKQALDQNINLKVEVQARGREVKKMKKRQTELEKALDVGNEERTALQRELRELERRLSSWEGGRRHDEREEEIQELQLRNEELAADMEEMGNLMQEHVEEKERLQDLLTQQQPASRNANMSMVSEGGERRSKERIARLEAELEQLRDEAQQELEDARIREDDLIDEVNGLKTSIEALERRREAENMERSESRSMMLEEREAREDLEEGYNAARDKLAAMQLELQDSEDALAQKDQDIDQIVQQHNAILAENDANWQEEIQQAREQAEQLQDVSSLQSVFYFALTHSTIDSRRA
jgi:chromosome segregation ATPase